jgi:hypothetical protein
MFRAGCRHNPDCDLRVHERRVGDQLAQVVVVEALKLVLDDDRAARPVSGHEIDAESAAARSRSTSTKLSPSTSLRTSMFSSSHVVRSYAS